MIGISDCQKVPLLYKDGTRFLDAVDSAVWVSQHLQNKGLIREDKCFMSIHLASFHIIVRFKSAIIEGKRFLITSHTRQSKRQIHFQITRASMVAMPEKERLCLLCLLKRLLC